MQPPCPSIGDAAWAASPKHHLAVAPGDLRQPFDRGAVDVAVALDRGQILQHRRAEVGELLNEPALAPGDGVFQAGEGNVAEAVGHAVAGRAQPEEAVAAEPELHAFESAGADRGQAAPHHLAGVSRPQPAGG
jgi:hypothetical protein